MSRKCFLLFLCCVFLRVNIVPVLGQEPVLPAANQILAPGPMVQPVLFRGLRFDSRYPLRLEFLLDPGAGALDAQALQDRSAEMTRYFLAALTTPAADLWVNLSPKDVDRIVPDAFGRTAMGRDLVAQDYILKQITASLLHPDQELGKKFWNEVYRRLQERYGTTDIPVDTFNRVWVVPQRAVIHEMPSGDGQGISAYISEASLKILAEKDYLAGKFLQQQSEPVQETVSAQQSVSEEVSLAVLREVILPVLDEEVNRAEQFAPLRQVYYSLLLAVWLKKKLAAASVEGVPSSGRTHLLQNVFVNKNKTAGIETVNPRHEVAFIYGRYLEAFREGAYNLVREDVDFYSDELIPRKYFSGGANFLDTDQALIVRQGLPGAAVDRAQVVQVVLKRFRSLGRLAVFAVFMGLCVNSWAGYASATTGANVSVPVQQITIAPGASSWGIANQYRTTLKTLAKLNPQYPDLARIPAGGIMNVPSSVPAGEVKAALSVEPSSGRAALARTLARQIVPDGMAGTNIVRDAGDVRHPNFAEAMPSTASGSVTREEGPSSGPSVKARHERSVMGGHTASDVFKKLGVLEAMQQAYARSQNLKDVFPAFADYVRFHYYIVRKESTFNPYAVSPQGAVGLGQIMPATLAGKVGKSKSAEIVRDIRNKKHSHSVEIMQASAAVLDDYLKPDSRLEQAIVKVLMEKGILQRMGNNANRVLQMAIGLDNYEYGPSYNRKTMRAKVSRIAASLGHIVRGQKTGYKAKVIGWYLADSRVNVDMDGAQAVSNDVGGIDLSASERLDLGLANDGAGVPVKFSALDLERLDQDIAGFVPQVLDVRPVASLAAFMSGK